MNVDDNLALDRIFERIFKVEIKTIVGWSYDSVPIWDSLAQLELVLAIEEHWEVTFDNQKVPFLENYEDFKNYLDRLLHS
jgi:acyl carrier protein